MQRCALVLVVASLFALPVQGAVTLVSSDGDVAISAMVGTIPIMPGPGMPAFGHSISRADSGLFQQNLYDVVSAPWFGTVSAMTSQVSSFSLTPGNQLAGASFAGTSAVTAAVFDPYGSQTKALSRFSFVFQVADTPVDYNLPVSFFPLGNPYGSAIQLWDLNANTLLNGTDSGTSTVNGTTLTGTLQPGLYRLSAWTGYDALALGPVAFASSMTYNLTLTPEPASLALLALGGLAVLRRRR